MKHTLLISLGIFISTFSFGQITTGTKFIGSHLNGSLKSEEKYGQIIQMHSLQLTPSAGYFLNNNLVVGLQSEIGISSSTRDAVIHSTPTTGYITYPNSSNVKEKSFRFGLAPFVRYYIPAGSQFAFFAEARTGIARTKTTLHDESSWTIIGGGTGPVVVDPNGTPVTSTNEYESVENSFYSGIAPGVVFYATPKIGIELKLNILDYTRYKNSSMRSSGSKLDADFSLAKASFGAGFYF